MVFPHSVCLVSGSHTDVSWEELSKINLDPSMSVGSQDGLYKIIRTKPL